MYPAPELRQDEPNSIAVSTTQQSVAVQHAGPGEGEAAMKEMATSFDQ